MVLEPLKAIGTHITTVSQSQEHIPISCKIARCIANCDTLCKSKFDAEEQRSLTYLQNSAPAEPIERNEYVQDIMDDQGAEMDPLRFFHNIQRQ